jgi:hypothetical protein
MSEWKEPRVIAEEKEPGVQKKLDFGEDGADKAYLPRSGMPPPPPSAQEQKRPKNQTTPNKSVTAVVASGEEGRLSQ